ncbi:nuclear transport factor 2 family protein [Brevundimonas sp. GCM10030266]|uniref:nuclear transport factor 2 family protein n=1 Tax=Brevundimonas sp. GCM10030266 TaxID=3273386 RepID=UPI00361301CF
MIIAAALALTLQATTPSGAVIPGSAEHQAVLAPVNAVFDALAARNAAGLDAHFDPDARLTVVHEQAGSESRVTHITLQQFAGGLEPGPEALEEVMPNPTVAIDGDVAMVWGQYVFRIDGRLSHCGVDHFNLVRQGGVWKITSLTWNQRTTGCEALDAATRAR